MTRIPVTDGDENADIYGYAETAESALAIARGTFADEVVKVERYGPIKLRAGGTLEEAFVAITKGIPCANMRDLDKIMRG